MCLNLLCCRVAWVWPNAVGPPKCRSRVGAAGRGNRTLAKPWALPLVLLCSSVGLHNKLLNLNSKPHPG